MPHFDVLNEPWIPVVASTGELSEVGLREALLNAHHLREVVCDSPLETYAIQRFLIAFLMDAYQLELVDDRKALFDSGSFDAEVIERYIALCRTEGVSFDLFDPQRPFMQAPYLVEYDDGKEKPAANLFHSLPTGNNHVHFDHRLAERADFTPAECLRGILASQTFAVAMAQGYPSSVNDTPCYYVLLRGGNLFETLCLNMIAKREAPAIEWNLPPVAWRDTCVLVPKSEFPNVSMLGGLTWQPRRILLIPDDDSMVRRMYFQQGRSFHLNGLWRDPHVSFAINREGRPYTLKPQTGRQVWRDVGVFAMSQQDRNSSPATVIQHSNHLLSEDSSRILMLYGLITAQAKYEGWITDRLNVPANILLDYEKGDRLRLDVAFVESVGELLHDTMNTLINAKERTGDGKKKANQLAEDVQMMFLAPMHHFLFSDYMTAISAADCEDLEWADPLVKQLNETAVKEARKILRNYAAILGNTAKDFEEQALAIQRFERELAKILSERM